MKHNTFDIVLLGEGDAERSINSIVKHTTNPDDAMLVLPDPTGEMQKFSDVDFNLAAVPIPPMSVPVIANSIIAGCTGSYVVLCHSGVEVKTDGWLEKMRDAFEETTAAVGPRTNFKSTYQGRHEECGILRPKPLPSLKGAAIGEWPLDFSCVMLCKEAWQDIGGFDEKYPTRYWPDDWMMRAYMTGWSFAVNTDVYAEIADNQTGLLGDLRYPAEMQALRYKWNPVFSTRAIR